MTCLKVFASCSITIPFVFAHQGILWWCKCCFWVDSAQSSLWNVFPHHIAFLSYTILYLLVKHVLLSLSLSDFCHTYIRKDSMWACRSAHSLAYQGKYDWNGFSMLYSVQLLCLTVVFDRISPGCQVCNMAFEGSTHHPTLPKISSQITHHEKTGTHIDIMAVAFTCLLLGGTSNFKDSPISFLGTGLVF